MECDSKRYHETFVRGLRRLSVLSPNRHGREVYRLCKEIDGRPEASGTFALFALRVIKLSLWDRREGAFYEPLGSYDDLLKLIIVNARLLEGRVPAAALNTLSVSVKIFESAYGAPLGELQIPEPGEAEQGIHNITVNGGWARRGEALRFQNSWGEWGDKGYGLLSREYLERYMIEAWLARRATFGPSRFTRPLLQLNAADARAYAAVWMLESPMLRAVNSHVVESSVRHDDTEYLIRIRETESTSEETVEMVELLDPSGVPLGWTHLHHLVDARPRISVVKELFVWPRVRRLGYGRLLEDLTAVQARKRGSEKLCVLFHEADDYPGNVTTAKAFATSAGYEWQ